VNWHGAVTGWVLAYDHVTFNGGDEELASFALNTRRAGSAQRPIFR